MKVEKSEWIILTQEEINKPELDKTEVMEIDREVVAVEEVVMEDKTKEMEVDQLVSIVVKKVISQENVQNQEQVEAVAVEVELVSEGLVEVLVSIVVMKVISQENVLNQDQVAVAVEVEEDVVVSEEAPVVVEALALIVVKKVISQENVLNHEVD